MLVLDPAKRYSVTQIKQHKWMSGEDDGLANDNIKHEEIPFSPGVNGVCVFNQHVLEKMCEMGIADEENIKQVS